MDNGTVNIPHGPLDRIAPEIRPAGLPRSEIERIAPSYLAGMADIRPAPPAPPKPSTFNDSQLATKKIEEPRVSLPTPNPAAGAPSLSPVIDLKAQPAQAPTNPAPQVKSAAFTAMKPAKGAGTNSTQNSLQIAEIRDGIIIMNDGSFRSVVMAKSINFDLMSAQEQEGVEYAYQGFLNSLYFPVQIFIRSQKVDLEPYLEKLDKIRAEHDNMLLVMLMEDYINFIDQLSQQTNIMDKKFYIVVPYFSQLTTQRAIDQSKNFLTGVGKLFNTKQQHVVVNEQDLEDAKTELRNRVNAVMDGLLQCGVQALPLDTQELIELYYDTYNPDTATRQQLKDFSGLSAPVVTKGQGQAPQNHLKSELT